MKNAIRYEVLSKGVREIEGTDLILSILDAKRIARSMANRLGAAVIVRHDLSLPTVEARIEAQRVIHRFRRAV